MKCFFTVLNFVTDEQFASSVSAISEPLDESRDESWAIIGGHWTLDTGHGRCNQQDIRGGDMMENIQAH